MSVESSNQVAESEDFPWDGNTLWVDDPSAVKQGLEESDYFEAHGQYGFDDDSPIDNGTIGEQYVAPDAGIVVTVNYRHGDANPIKAATIEESAQDFATIDEVSEAQYLETVDNYVHDVLSRSEDVNEDFRKSVEEWFQATYDESGPQVMADGGTPVKGGNKMGGPMGPVSKGPDEPVEEGQSDRSSENYVTFDEVIGL